jgi:phage terminase large subunit
MNEAETALQNIRLSELIPPEYYEFWNTKQFYVVCKGSKGSCKSTTAALWHIYMMMRNPQANTLVIRNVYGTISDSCYKDLLWAIDRLGVSQLWKATVNPLKLVFIPTKQEILFKGMDDALKIAGIKSTKGKLCWIWWEEFSEVTSEADFDRVMMSIRGILPPGLWKRCTITFNPWSEHHFAKKRFFDTPRDNTLAMTTTFRCNRWLGPEDIARYYEMYDTSPRMAAIVCDGDWGVAEGLVYENWTVDRFDIDKVIRDHPKIKQTFGLDFGFAHDPAAFVAVAVDTDSNTLWIYDEIYEVGLDNAPLAKRICEMGYGKKTIIADCAEPKSIYQLKRGFKEPLIDEETGEAMYMEVEKTDANGETITVREPLYATYQLPNIQAAFKGADSLKNGIRNIQSFKMIVHPDCSNVIMELNNYIWAKDKDGNCLDKPIDEYNHCLVAGTMVETDHGSVPIEDIEVGDMVLTHLGYRKVLASGITRPEPTEIWRVTFEDGTVVEGTFDHDIMTTKGYKNLGCLTIRDKVIQYLGTNPNASKASPSSTMGECGIGTPMQKQETFVCTTEAYLMENRPCCIGTSGRNSMGQSLPDMRSTISTAIPTTTTSPISNASLMPSMHGNTPGLRSAGKHGARPCSISTLRNNADAGHGMLPKKVMNGTFSTGRGLQRTSNLSNTHANTAVRSTWQSPLMGNSVQMPASQRPAERLGSTTRNAFVWYVERRSQSTDTIEHRHVLENVGAYSDIETIAKDCRLLSVARVEKTGRYEYVYDLTVDEAHDFFADCILVSNCCDALRYSLGIILSSGKGYVAETTAEPVMIADGPKTKCRRVFSTYD